MEIKNAYFAGLIDGEGYISMAPKDSKTNRPTVRVAMTCEKTVRALHEHFGVGSVHAIGRRTDRHKDQWEWQAVYNGALLVVKAIRPYLITKAEAADIVLQYQPVGRGNGRRKI